MKTIHSRHFQQPQNPFLRCSIHRGMITYHVFPRTNLSTNPTSAAYLWQSIMHTIITGGYSPPFQGSMCWCRQRRVPPILLLRAWRIARSIEPSVPGDVRCSTGKSPFYSKRNATLFAHSPAFHHFNVVYCPEMVQRGTKTENQAALHDSTLSPGTPHCATVRRSRSGKRAIDLRAVACPDQTPLNQRRTTT